MKRDIRPVKILADFILEKDKKVRHFLLTPMSPRAKDWLVDNTDHLAQYWGKSLMLKYWEIDYMTESIDNDGLEIYRRG